MSDLVSAILPRVAGEGDHPQDGGGGGRRLGIGTSLQIAWRQITRCEAAAEPLTPLGVRRDLPSPLAGEGARRADEGSLARGRLARHEKPCPSDPSSGASRHLLPQGEKGAPVLDTKLSGPLARFVTDLFAYGLVSVGALACDCGLLALFVHAGLHYLVASALSFTAGLGLAYVLSVRFVFRTRRVRSREVEAVGFVAVGVAGLVLTQLLLFVLVARLALSLATAKIVTTGIVFFFNFVTRRSLVFAGSSRAAA